MKWLRFTHDGHTRIGTLHGEVVQPHHGPMFTGYKVYKKKKK